MDFDPEKQFQDFLKILSLIYQSVMHSAIPIQNHYFVNNTNEDMISCQDISPEIIFRNSPIYFNLKRSQDNTFSPILNE